ncbi:alanine racemase [Leifsonia sp. F6_8S_P_1B]|uniref:Alanine racemase n=1 Tax=Leifsonia williamsii TaxID=3035919 RepID=A0ABT8KFF9_9MICO|nr:alanine racemase [Leifsonia williamsii]MDN4616181.1 alanine racemase [Leifsonia williamsii]
MSGRFREILVDLDAIRENVVRLREVVGTPHVMAVVKADAYGHGAVESAKAALAGGADWLGVADISEGLQLRAAGIEAPILAWLHDPGEDFAEAVAERIDLGLSSLPQLEAAAAARLDEPVAVQLKLETGLSRNGIPEEQWEAAFARARELERSGHIVVRGLFSHLSNASPEDDRAAVAVFTRGLERADAAGLRPELRHIAASAAALTLPEARFDLVRLGIAVYGLSPSGDGLAQRLGLRPAMTLRGRIAAVRRVPAGKGVSYDYTYRTDRETTLVLVPLGYAEGIPRHASNRAPVAIGGSTFRIAGRVAMDQFVVDVGDLDVTVGDEVVLFGDPATGVPAADDWADAAETINYEIVTRLGGRLKHSYVGGAQ